MITIELLKSWSPCVDGFKRFYELFPNGTDLFTAGEKLAEDGHAEWGLWLYEKSRATKIFEDITSKGYQNTGNWNTGNWNTGNWNTGNQNTGNQNTDSQNTGHRNTGSQNTGHRNTGYQNTGHRNTGHRNTGHQNTGYQNTGNWNTGNQNTGKWNTGDWNTGFFNLDTPKTIRVFGKEVTREIWDDCHKPSFLYFDITYWVSESEMTDEEKNADPNFLVRGGQLRKKDYKEAFIESWNNADKIDRERVRDLPNFDAEIFFLISGIDLR